ANSYDYGRIRKILDNGSEAGSVELGTPGQADFKLSRNNNKIIAYSAITKEFSVIDPTNMSIERTFAQAFDCTDDWDINGDASKIYCGDGIGIVNVYNSSDGSLATAHLIAFNQVSNPNLRVSADGNFIYVADAYNLYKYDVAQDATNSVGVSAQTRLNIADSRTARDQMSLNPAETRLYLGGGDKIEIFDVTSNTPVSLGHMDSAAANPRHDLVFSADGKRAFMAYAAPVNSQPGIVVAEFDTQNNLPMGVLNVDKNPLTGAGLVLSNNVTVVESATVSFDVNQPVIYDTNGSFEFIKNNPTTQDVATRYALGALSINVTGGNVPDGMTFGICNYGPEQRPCFQGTPVTPGSYTFTASISDGITNSEKEFNVTINNGIEFLNPNNESPNIQTTTGVTGQSYSATFSVRHRVGNSTISLINGTLPPGLNFTQVDNDTATITGTIDQNQPIEGVCFTLQATDDYNSNEQGFCMNIVATPLSITTGSLPDGTFTTPYNQTVYTAGGDAPTSFSVISGSLPSGLELDSGTGVISGTPSSPGTYTFTIRATDRTGSVEQEYVLVIQSGVNNNAEITTTSLSRGRINIRYTGDYVQRIQAANFTGDVSWSVVTGDLPAGLSLYQDGNDAIIDGTPTESGIFTFTVAASDGINDRTKELSIRIDPNPPEPARTSVTITSPTNGVSLGGPTQLVTGTASPAGSIIQLSIDNDNPFDVQVGGDGKWSFEAKGLTSGPHTFRASIKQSAREYAYVPNTYTHDVNIINTVTDTVVGTIKTPNPNLFTGGAWATKDGKTVYVGGGDVQTDPVFSISTLIYELDTATNTFKRSIRLENDQLNSFVIDASDRYAYTSTIDTTNGTKKLVKIDLKNMQIVKTTTVPSLGNYSPYLPFGYSALSDDESKLFIPYSASNFVSIVDTNTLTVIGSTDIGRPSIQLQALPDDKIVAMPFLEVPTANPVITILNQSGQVASTVTTDTQGTQVLYLGSLLSSDNQYIINRFSIPSENLNGISIANPTTLSNVGVLTGIGFGFGMSATADSQKVYVVNGNRDPVGGGFGWGSVDVIKNPTGMLVGSKYPIQVGLFTQALGNWIANIPETTISTSTSVNIYGGVKPSSGGTTVITLPGFRLPNISLPNIKPFNLPSYNFNPNLNLPNLAPITGLPTDKVSVSKTNAGVLDNLLGTLKTSVSLVPTKVALAFPYLMLLVLIVMILSLLAQTRDELEKAREIKRIIAKRKSLEEERNNFISLISHYLNTPISMMQGGVDLIATLQRAPKSMTDSLQKTLSSLGQKIKSMLTSTAQSSLDKPVDTKNPIMIKPYKSFAVMAPVILVAVFTAATNWLFNAAGVVDISIINIFTQIMAFALLIQALFSTYKHHENAKHNLALAQASLDNEVTMAQARLHFLSGSVEELKTEVAGLRRNLPGLAAAPNAKAVKDGYARLQSILSRLQLLTEIEQDKHRGEIKSFNLRRAVENVISQYKPQLAARNITVDIDVTKSLYIKQDQQMLELVISSLIDNAIKFVPKSDGYIKIASRVNKGRISLTVSDNGAGIAKTKLKQLFKPFSRAESALRFNYEGLGLSLYLDKVIVEKLGGTIQIESSKGSGTTVTIDLSPQHKPVSTPKKR
ncbi:putative Ig domain-containing protein, partial [bacterium]|nr:putative Ig domain-containing protein [bacterium]